ncbi:DNA-binding transcriptional regulator, AcrR family [Microlunatus soli]|uniref:DNA-binding transcriptional regulator, AcrR family n=2 Tax=Microlunatus soli TaxID=630515 RepID=A0A1H1TIN3_9ACTN|nr:DNA-binding transcriptional regulator, AcrR family [Microlunatus soli]
MGMQQTDPDRRTGPVQTRPKRSDVRARIIAAARESFLRNGYQRTNLGEVAAQAGFSKGAVYSNFGGKSDLFTEVINEQTSAVTGSVLASSRRLASVIADPTAVARIADDLTEQIIGGESTLAMLAEVRVLASTDPELSEVYGRLRSTQRQHLLDDLRRRAADLGLEIDFDEARANLLLTLVQSLATEYAAAPDAMPPSLIADTLQIAIRGVLR